MVNALVFNYTFIQKFLNLNLAYLGFPRGGKCNDWFKSFSLNSNYGSCYQLIKQNHKCVLQYQI